MTRDTLITIQNLINFMGVLYTDAALPDTKCLQDWTQSFRKPITLTYPQFTSFSFANPSIFAQNRSAGPR